jgi:preprotein translocase subunit YajC
MSSFLESILLLAEEAPPAKNAAQGNLGELLFPIVALMFLWYFVLIRPQRKDKAKREDLLNAIKKNDQVVSIGGIIGTVVNLSEDEITIRVDDNTRIKMLRSSIQTVRTDSTKQESK